MGNIFSRSSSQQAAGDASKAKLTEYKKTEDNKTEKPVTATEEVAEVAEVESSTTAGQSIPEAEKLVEPPFQDVNQTEFGQDAAKLETPAAEEKKAVEEKSVPTELTLETMQMSIAEAALSQPVTEPVEELEKQMVELAIEPTNHQEHNEEQQETPEIVTETAPEETSSEAEPHCETNLETETKLETSEEIVHHLETEQPAIIEHAGEPDHDEPHHNVDSGKELPDLIEGIPDEMTHDITHGVANEVAIANA